ncbi:MAG: alpha/beta fold hydrolase [Pseudomonadales bacterium]|nr:alpha/beta fold hydrolase [Pseudomonadales bacterium]
MTNPALSDIADLPQSPEWFNQAFEVPRTEGYAELDGVPIHYFRWGNPDLPGVVLTHGFMAHARCWAFIAPLLAEQYCLAAFDLSGMGDSGWRDEYDVSVRSRECRAVADHAGLKNPALVCHSYGGSVGLMAAVNDPDYWSRLIVCDMTMLAPGEPSQFEEHQRRREARGIRPHQTHSTYAAIRHRFRLAPEQPCANEYLMDYMATHSVKETEGGYVWKFDPAIMSMDDNRSPDWWTSIAPTFVSLPIPRGIIYGQHSAMMSDRVKEFVRKESDGAIPLIGVPGAYHHIMMDQPIAFTTAIDALLQTL